MMKYLLSLFIFLSILSCEKEHLVFELEGLVLDEISKEPIENVKINLFQKQYNQNVLNDNYIAIGSVTTDSEGKYAYTFDRSKIYSIKFELEHDSFYNENYEYSQDLLKTGEINKFDFELEAKAWFKFIIKNLEVTSDEQLNLFRSNFKEDCLECCGNENISIIQQDDTTFNCAVTGGAIVKVDYGTSNNTSVISNEIECVRFDTTVYRIFY